MSTPALSPVSENDTPYDKVPYPSAAFPQTHPNRLGAMARLFGVAAGNPTNARVLEIGCADGANLLPMAEQMPGATFLGIDASKVQIEAGQRAVKAAGLTNVELRFQDALDFPASERAFDYIIVHGVFSWVPEAVRERILAICSEHLTEHGVAYISYNAQPGWNMRRSIREMMLFHAQNFSDTKVKVQQARALLTFLADSVPTENNAYGMLLKGELAAMKAQPDNFIVHDLLEKENTPFYFYEFAARAGRHGLQYLAEPSVAEMLSANFPEKVRSTLAQLSDNIVAQEQYMDFLRNRPFRQTMLCRAKVPVRRNISPADVKQFSFRSMVSTAAASIDMTAGVAADFSTQLGAKISTADPFVKGLLTILAESKGAYVIAYDELLESSRIRSRPFLGQLPANRDAVDDATLQSNLLSLVIRGFVEIHVAPVKAFKEVPVKPAIGKFARYQALHARLITNRVHHSIKPDVFSRYVIAACDGNRTRDEILAELVMATQQGKLNVSQGEKPVTGETEIRVLLAPRLDVVLRALAEMGFFAA